MKLNPKALETLVNNLDKVETLLHLMYSTSISAELSSDTLNNWQYEIEFLTIMIDDIQGVLITDTTD